MTSSSSSSSIEPSMEITEDEKTSSSFFRSMDAVNTRKRKGHGTLHHIEKMHSNIKHRELLNLDLDIDVLKLADKDIQILETILNRATTHGYLHVIQHKALVRRSQLVNQNRIQADIPPSGSVIQGLVNYQGRPNDSTWRSMGSNLDPDRAILYRFLTMVKRDLLYKELYTVFFTTIDLVIAVLMVLVEWCPKISPLSQRLNAELSLMKSYEETRRYVYDLFYWRCPFVFKDTNGRFSIQGYCNRILNELCICIGQFPSIPIISLDWEDQVMTQLTKRFEVVIEKIFTIASPLINSKVIDALNTY